MIMPIYCSCIIALCFSANVIAGTPDDETPAEEIVCTEAGFDGAAWGLCNAYCEAMDCDSNNPSASDKACARVLANFEKQTDGAEIPCGVGVTCPCLKNSADEPITIDDLTMPPEGVSLNCNFGDPSGNIQGVSANFEPQDPTFSFHTDLKIWAAQNVGC